MYKGSVCDIQSKRELEHPRMGVGEKSQKKIKENLTYR